MQQPRNDRLKISRGFWVSAVFASIYCFGVSDHHDWLFLGLFHYPNVPGWLLMITFFLGLPITLPVAVEKVLGAGLGVALAMVIVYLWALSRTTKTET
jgi:hypothetical protein